MRKSLSPADYQIDINNRNGMAVGVAGGWKKSVTFFYQLSSINENV